jgi:hypothetical protein
VTRGSLKGEAVLVHEDGCYEACWQGNDGEYMRDIGEYCVDCGW